MSAKLERIRQMCEADPSNAFAWYSLALEQKKTDKQASLLIFERIRRDHADYLPNYYHFGKTLEEQGDNDAARRVFQEGVALAQRTGDAHTHGELQEALELLEGR